MGILLAKLFHRGLQSAWHVAALNVALIERLHEVGSALVVDIPKRKKQRGGAGAEEAALQSQQFIACGDKIHSGCASAQCHELGGKTNLIEIVKIQIAVSHANAGKHWVVLPVGSMSGDVQQAAG